MEKLMFLLLSMMLLGVVFAAPGESSLVVSSTEPSNGGDKEGAPIDVTPQHPVIYEMDISSNISNRFAKTLVTSKVKNAEKVAKETTFTVVLPDQAFISEFVMEIGGQSYKAYVKEKEEAKQIYNQAVASGQSAGHVAVNTRDSNKFTVSVNIEPESKVVFLLTYEELLQRKNDQYELIINIHPGQIVKKLNVDVKINETRPLKFVKTPSLRSGNEISKNDDKLDPSSDIEVNSTRAVVKFNPDSERQRQFARDLGEKESDGVSGQFVVQYDVERDPQGGEILLEDGYFVHFFAPKDLEPLPKHVLFVLDSSSSMLGRKIEQLRDAMQSILKEVHEGDMMSIIDFNHEVQVWDIDREDKVTPTFTWDFDYNHPFTNLSRVDLPIPVVINNETLAKAKHLAQQLPAYGSTNIIGALETALYIAKVTQESPSIKKYQPIMIFLTDGQPNVGVGSTDEITKIITRLNTENNKIPIFSLSFGTGADKSFLRKLSLNNQGFSRHIYEAADASLQIQEFYKQISSPLLSNIKFKYVSDVKDVTKTRFPIYFKGSEIVVTGRYNVSDSKRPIAESVSSWCAVGPKLLPPTADKPVTSLERLWAYLTVKQTLDERELSDNKEELTKKALDLALKYSFVTDVTSLVVVKPNETNSVDTEKAHNEYDSDSSTTLLYLPDGYARRGPSLHSFNSPVASRSGGFQPVAFAAGSGYQPSYSMAAARSGYQPLYSMAAGVPGAVPVLSPPIYRQYASFAPRPTPPAYQPINPAYQVNGGPTLMLPSPPLPPHSYRSYTDYSLQYTTTTFPTTSATSASTSTSKPQLVDALPWLASVLNQNGTLTIDQNIYELGNTSSPALNGESICPQTPLNSTGTGSCAPLPQCPQVHSYLTDFSVYQRYFCAIDDSGTKYAGVCCIPLQDRIF